MKTETIESIISELHKARCQMGLILQAYEGAYETADKCFLFDAYVIAYEKHDEWFIKFEQLATGI